VCIILCDDLYKRGRVPAAAVYYIIYTRLESKQSHEPREISTAVYDSNNNNSASRVDIACGKKDDDEDNGHRRHWGEAMRVAVPPQLNVGGILYR